MTEKSKVLFFIILFGFALISAFLIFTTALHFNNDKSLSLLAGQFVTGHISLEPNTDLPAGDISIYNGKYYMYFGPLASLILMIPVAIFGTNFSQATLGIAALIVSFFSTYILSRAFRFSKVDSLWLSLFMTFSTVLLSTSLINITSYTVEAMGVPLILLSLVFYFSKKQYPLLSGIFLGLAVMTRIILVLAVVFFIFEFIAKRLSLKNLVLIIIPIVIACAILGTYNFLRFNNPLETGYNHHMKEPYPLSRNYEFGTTNIIHIPANLYAFFIKPPVPILHYEDGFVFKFPYLKADPWGMAIWFTSPLFLFLFFGFRKNKYFKSALVTTLLIAVPIVTYYSVGFAQFGYRWTLDFLPFLFLLLIPTLLPKLSKTAIILIAIGVIFNCIYITSLWNVYPHFGII